MTGSGSPEQHAATVRSTRYAYSSREDRKFDAALDELVALARDAELMRAAATIRGNFRDEWRKRAEAVEARADELQRERDRAAGVADSLHRTLDQSLRNSRDLERDLEQARREADQLREKLDEKLAEWEDLATNAANALVDPRGVLPKAWEEGRAVAFGIARRELAALADAQATPKPLRAEDGDWFEDSGVQAEGQA